MMIGINVKFFFGVSLLLLLIACVNSTKVIEVNGSWYAHECYSNSPCELYFDDNFLYYTNNEMGRVVREIEWESSNRFLIKQDSTNVRFEIKADNMEILFFNERKDSFSLNRVNFEYHPKDVFCSSPRSLDCSSCENAAFEMRWQLLTKRIYKTKEEWDNYLENQSKHLEKLENKEMVQCWAKLRKFYTWK